MRILNEAEKASLPDSLLAWRTRHGDQMCSWDCASVRLWVPGMVTDDFTDEGINTDWTAFGLTYLLEAGEMRDNDFDGAVLTVAVRDDHPFVKPKTKADFDAAMKALEKGDKSKALELLGIEGDAKIIDTRPRAPKRKRSPRTKAKKAKRAQAKKSKRRNR